MQVNAKLNKKLAKVHKELFDLVMDVEGLKYYSCFVVTTWMKEMKEMKKWDESLAAVLKAEGGTPLSNNFHPTLSSTASKTPCITVVIHSGQNLEKDFFKEPNPEGAIECFET